MRKLYTPVIAILILCCFTSEIKAQVTEAEVPESEVLEKLMQTIPSPSEFSSLVKEIGIKFNPELLNSPANISKYNSDYQKAINLGIYSTDLGYLNVYENKDSLGLVYLTSIKQIADKLDVGAQINFGKITQYAMLNNVNGLLSETSYSFDKINRQLVDEKKGFISVLILTGGWLETLYLTCQAAKEYPNKLLDTRVAEQKIILEQILPILKTYEKGEQMAELYRELSSLNEFFQKIRIKQKIRSEENYEIQMWGELEVIVYLNEADSKDQIKYKAEDLNDILKETSLIRSKMVEAK